MWTCPKCKEELEDEFDSCWKCAGSLVMPKDEKAQRPLRDALMWVGVSLAVDVLGFWYPLWVDSTIEKPVDSQIGAVYLLGLLFIIPFAAWASYCLLGVRPRSHKLLATSLLLCWSPVIFVAVLII